MKRSIYTLNLKSKRIFKTDEHENITVYSEKKVCDVIQKHLNNDLIESIEKKFSDRLPEHYYFVASMEPGNLVYRMPNHYKGIHDSHMIDNDNCEVIGMITPDQTIETRFTRVLIMARIHEERLIKEGILQYTIEDKSLESQLNMHEQTWDKRTRLFCNNEQRIKIYAGGLENAEFNELVSIQAEARKSFTCD